MNYRFFRKDTGEWEFVEPELWQWEAHYTNGEVLKQFTEGATDYGTFFQFKEIDQERLYVFKMTNGKQTFTLLFEPGMKLIHFYRTVIVNSDAYRIKLYCFGYQRNGEKVLMVITPNGEMIVTDDISKIKVI